MSMPWREIDLQDHPTEITHVNGRWVRDFIVVTDDDTVKRIHDGYICIHCFEPFDTAFPAECRLCHYKVKKNQPRDFERMYKGADPTIVTETLDERYARDHEPKARALRSGIFVP